MDRPLRRLNAGYGVWVAHYTICEAQPKTRKPSPLIDGADADIVIVGEAFSTDQAGVEGACCTAESVRNDFLGANPTVGDGDDPCICPC